MNDDPVAPRKSKRQRFLGVAEGRTLKALRAIRILGRCSNRSAYEYTPADVEKVFDALQHELDAAKRKFYREKELKFTLGEEVS